jgi:hypothetical protein
MLDNLLTPPILFFLLGGAASLVKSDLEIPKPASRFIALYLLFAIGLHGGHELSQSDLDMSVLFVVLSAVFLSMAVPVWSFFFLRRFLPVHDAAAIGAAYGSVSAVTFITAVGFLNSAGIPFSGHMVAVMALMESPAIIAGVFLVRCFEASSPGQRSSWGELFREAFLNGSVFLLLGSLAIGWICGDEWWTSLEPVVHDPFKGILCLFLLDMGLVAAKRLKDLKASGPRLVGFAVGAAVVHAMIGIGFAKVIGINQGDALLLAVLAGGASYIAVPAALQLAIPRAKPSLYIPLALGVTFPFNVVFGIPLYHAVIQVLWGVS